MSIIKFIENFKDQLENDEFNVAPDTDYVKSDFWDSLTNMVITVMLEDDYNVKIGSEDLNKFSSIQELYDFVERNKE